MAQDRNKTPAARARKARYREKHRDDLRAKGRAYAKEKYASDPVHAERCREKKRLLLQEAPEHLRAINRRSYAAHAEKRKQERKDWYAANRERALAWAAENWRSKTEDERRARYARKDERKQSNLDHVRRLQANSSQRRRARERAAPVIEHVDRLTVYLRDTGICHLCGSRAPQESFHVDHVIPLARGGEHSYRNVRVAHKRCNLSKGARI